jgi:hypothetical protein
MKRLRETLARFPTGCDGLWKTCAMTRGLDRYEISRQVKIRQAALGFPQPLPRRKDPRRRLDVAFRLTKWIMRTTRVVKTIWTAGILW